MITSLSRTKPDRQRLLAWAMRLAREGHEIEPPVEELESRIDYVLFGHKLGWAGLDEGLYTEVEIRELLIAHFDYECSDRSGRSWDELPATLRGTLVSDLDDTLYGRAASG